MSRGAEGGAARAYLAGLQVFGIKLGLSTIRALCDALDNPQRRYQTLLIAGTNGKGSVAAMTAEALRAAGYRTGRYTSPHLVRLEERIEVDGRPVEPHALDGAVLSVRGAADRLQAGGDVVVHPTFFEVTTTAAFLLFQTAGVDVAVLEVGLGGRFDATNVADPIATAITSVALDHERHLGQSLAAIAFEKAGIIRPGVPVVVGDLPLEAREVVLHAACERGAPVVDARARNDAHRWLDDGRTEVHVATPGRDYGRVVLALRGRHQVSNALVAVRLLEAAAARGLAITTEAVRAGLEQVRWPARLELIDMGEQRQLLLDGAHNPAAAAALAAYIARLAPAGLPLVFGAMIDKDLAGMLRALAGIARPLIATTAPGPRAAPAAAIADVARELGLTGVVVRPDLPDGLAEAWTHGARIAAAGSLYLAGRILEIVQAT